jgi:hypothetical protein
MKPKESWPIAVFQKAHAEYPKEVGKHGLYAMAFFGHSRPIDLDHQRTCGSVWRGLCRRLLREYIQERGKV